MSAPAIGQANLPGDRTEPWGGLAVHACGYGEGVSSVPLPCPLPSSPALRSVEQ